MTEQHGGGVGATLPAADAAPVTPAERARGRIRLGLIFGLGGALLAVLTFLGMAAVGGADFPFARLIALLLLLLFVGSLAGAARGIYETVKGLVALGRAR